MIKKDRLALLYLEKQTGFTFEDLKYLFDELNEVPEKDIYPFGIYPPWADLGMTLAQSFRWCDTAQGPEYWMKIIQELNTLERQFMK